MIDLSIRQLAHRGPSLLLLTTVGLLSLAVMVLTSGCNVFAFAGYAAMGLDNNEKKFQLADKPTLIFVDDPGNLLGSPTLTAVVASSLDFHLEKNDAFLVEENHDGGGPFGEKKPLPEQPIIPQRALYQVQIDLGDKFQEASIAEIGKLTGAKQVIHVLISEVQYQTSPGFFRPRAVSEVKVLDLELRERVFPPQQAFEAGMAGSQQTLPGSRVMSELRVDTYDSGTGGPDMLNLQQQLARRIGRDVGRLFYDWKPEEPGHRFSEDEF